jgi:hypothetical protein
MVFDIVNTVLLMFVILINYRVLKNVNTLQTKNISKLSSSSLADDIMSCDNCDSCDSCVNTVNSNNCNNCNNYENSKRNDISISIQQPVQNIYADEIDNDKVKLLEINQNNKQREWTEIQIVK